MSAPSWPEYVLRHLVACGLPYYGQITGTDDGVEGSWLIELYDDGAPISGFVFIPVESMPDVVPVWSIELPIGDDAGVLPYVLRS